MKIAVIGSGVAGMASGARLAAKGHEVHVYESNSYPGGKISAFEQGKFRFDAGPSLFTLPEHLDAVFYDSGKNPRDYYNYKRIEKSCHYFFDDKTRLIAYSDQNRFAKEVQDKTGTNAKSVIDHLNKSAFLYEKTHALFMEKSLHKLSNYFTKDVLEALINVFKLNLNASMHEVNSNRFKDPRLVQLFDRFATYNGSNPYKAPGVLNIIPHLEHNLGTYFPIGGLHQITLALVKLSKDLGVNFHFNTEVGKIIIEKNKVKGININGKEVEFDRLISNADIYPTYKKLLKGQKEPEKILKQERSSSALIFYWGVKKEFPELDLHNILFSGNYKKEFDYLFGKKEIYTDPTVYINISSKYNSKDAPKGSENWFVMINAPANTGQNWDQFIEKSRRNIQNKINNMLNTKIEDYIESESILDPRSIESKTSSYQGSLYGTSSNTKFSAFLRHPNFSQNIKGLYFCGGSVHPGGGIPLCLLSGKIVSELIK